MHTRPKRQLLILGAWAGLIGPLAYVATWAVAGVLTEDYDPVRDAISELAAVGAPAAPAMSAAFVVFGLLGVPFALAVREVMPNPGPTVLAMVVTSLATIGAGLAPCSPGCPGPGVAAAVTDNAHAVMATIGYAALIAAPLLAAQATRSSPGWRRFALTSVVVGALGTAGILAWTAGLAGPGFGGLLQRGFNTLVDVWWVGLALLVLRRGRVAAADRSPRQDRPGQL